ncbi:Codeine O-demethylase [Linum grandiflorum]
MTTSFPELPAGFSDDDNQLAPPVVIVQELAKQPLTSIPRRFVAAANDDQQLVNGITPRSLETAPAPTVDMELLLSADRRVADLELERLHSCCMEWGIFQLVNHGVEMETLRFEVEEFYKLPVEEKMRFKERPGEYEGYGGTGRLKGRLEWGDRFYMNTNPVARRKHHLFLQLPPSFKESMEAYLQELQKLAMRLVGLMANAIKTERKKVEEMMEDGMQSVRMNYYPPCPRPELVMGITPHSDASCITILNQVNGVDGLMIVKDGSWVPLTFLPHSLVVNVGDILEVLSNGMYKSVEHSVTVNSKKERISLSFFFNPKFDAEIGPATDIITPHNPPKFKRKGMEQYVKDYFAMKMDGKSNLEHMKIINEADKL